MAITKQLLLPNKRVRCRKPNGEVTYFSATPEMIDKIVQTGNEMIATGYDVPLPYEHDLDVILSLKTNRDKSIYEDLNRNSGFITKFIKDAEGGLSCVFPDGTAEGKLGKTIKHTSIYLREKFIDTDLDRNKIWEYAPMHVALTNKPSMTGLKGFEKVPDAMLLSMDSDDDVSTDRDMDEPIDDVAPDTANTDKQLANVIKELESRYGLRLPKSTTIGNLLDKLEVAAMNAPKLVPESSLQKEGSDETEVDPMAKQDADDEVTNMPEGAKPAKGFSETGVWAMSEAELKAQVEKLTNENAVLLSQRSDISIKSYRQRTEALAKKGVKADVLSRRIYPILDKKDAAGKAVLLSQVDEDKLEALISTLEETIVESTAHDDEEAALLSQQYEGNTEEELSEEDKAYLELKKNLASNSRY